jgi:hypothetical protein
MDLSAGYSEPGRISTSQDMEEPGEFHYLVPVAFFPRNPAPAHAIQI